MSSEILSEDNRLALQELCARCGLPETVIRSYVSEGVIEAEGGEQARLHFAETTIVRVMKARRLEQDLGLNAAGAALALELLEEIETLKKEIARLRRDLT